MLQDTSDIVETELRDAGIFLPGKQGFPLFPDALVRMHTGAVVPKDRLGHEGGCFAMPAGHVLDDVLVHHQFVCRLDQRVEADINFRLARRRRLVVVLLNGNPGLLHLQDHLAADILVCISRRDRKVAFLVTDFPAQVVAFLPNVPGAFFGIDEVVAAVARLIVPDLIEDEELRLRPPVGDIPDLRALEIFFRLQCHKPRITIVGLARNRIDDIADDAQCRDRTERIETGRGRIGDHQQIAVVDRLPAPDRRTVQPGSIFEYPFIKLFHRNREVLPGAEQIYKLQVHDLDLILLRKLQYLAGIHSGLLSGSIYATDPVDTPSDASTRRSMNRSIFSLMVARMVSRRAWSSILAPC